jgi:hypothetical protein
MLQPVPLLFAAGLCALGLLGSAGRRQPQADWASAHRGAIPPFINRGVVPADQPGLCLARMKVRGVGVARANFLNRRGVGNVRAYKFKKNQRSV